jgi:hypothetical protein
LPERAIIKVGLTDPGAGSQDRWDVPSAEVGSSGAGGM